VLPFFETLVAGENETEREIKVTASVPTPR